MSDTTAQTEATSAGEQSQEQDGTAQFVPIGSQEALDRIVQARLARERSKYADYDDLKAKATKFDETVEANKTDLQKAIDRAEKAENKLVAAEALATRSGIVAEYQIPTDYQDLLTASDAEGLRAQAEKVQALLKSRSGVVLNEGKQPNTSVGSGDPLRDQFRNL